MVDINVVDPAYGAIPNDGQDDSVAIQAAVNAAKSSGANVYFPAGTYELNKKVTFNSLSNQQAVYGQTGPNGERLATIFALPTYQKSTSTYDQEGLFDFINSPGVTVRDLKFDGNGRKIPMTLPNGDPLIYIHGIQVSSSDNFKVIRTELRDTVGSGVHFFRSGSTTISDNLIVFFGHGGFTFDRCSNMTVTNNRITGNGNKGTTKKADAPGSTRQIRGTSGILVTGVGKPGNGPDESPQTGGLIQGNSIQNVGAGGIKVEDQIGVSISNPFRIINNSLNGFGKDGIKVHVVSTRNLDKVVKNFLIQGNTVRGYNNWRGDGLGYIVAESAQNVRILNNTILGNRGLPPAIVPDGGSMPDGEQKFTISDWESGIWVGRFPLDDPNNNDDNWLNSGNVVIRNNSVRETRIPIRLRAGEIDAPSVADTNVIVGTPLDDNYVDDGQSNIIRGVLGNDTLSGGAGNDDIDGGDGDDLLRGGTGADNICGCPGNDELQGGTGNDTLTGQSGNDVLIGTNMTLPTPGTEIDVLTGGTGVDTFVLGVTGGNFYDDRNLTNPGQGSYARITDFNNEDQIQLKSIAQQYVFGVAPTGLTGIGLFVDNDGVSGLSGNDELIAVISNRSLGSADAIRSRFTFV